MTLGRNTTTDPGEAISITSTRCSSYTASRAQYALDWRYLATDDSIEKMGHEVDGLNLPRSVLKKRYHDNAVRWIPGIDAGPP